MYFYHMSNKFTLDLWDIKILYCVQDDADMSVTDMAEKVGLSVTPCWRRLKKLKDLGIIRNSSANLDRLKLGLNFVSYNFVKLALPSRENMEIFERTIKKWPEVIACERVTGDMDYLVKVVCPTIEIYDLFLREKLLSLGTVSESKSNIVISSVIEKSGLPLEYVETS